VAEGAHFGPFSNRQLDSFPTAKKLLLTRVYVDHRRTFYCNSAFDLHGRLEHDAGYQPLSESERAWRLEWEHVVPAQAFGQSFAEWRSGSRECVDGRGEAYKGRRCAEKVSEEYRVMQADMHNLVPAIGELNGLRSNYSYAMIPGEERRFGACDMEIAGRKAEPPPGVRGDIARSYLYMEAAYPGRGVVSDKNRRLFEAWDRTDPVDTWECERQRRIETLQGNRNPFVAEACSERGL